MSLAHIISDCKWYRLKTLPILQSLKQGGRNGICYRPRPMWRAPYQAPQVPRPRSIHSSVTSRQLIGKGRESRLILEHEYTVQKDTVLYRYNNPKFFRYLNVFAMSQFLFWTYLSHFAFTMMRDTPVSEETKNNPNLPWWRKMNFGKFRNGITIGCFFVGWGTMAIAWMYTLRCVKYLVLKKGGNTLLFVTFSPFNRTKYMAVPLKEVSAKQSRVSANVYLPLKVKGKYMYFILDMQGEFLNTKLFDYSAGLQRNWAK